VRRKESTGTQLPRFSLNRRITVLVLFLTALVVGAVATQWIPVELIPHGYSSPSLRVSVPWPDAPPEEVLEKISEPLEEELRTVRGIDQIVSISSTGGSRCFLRFKQGTDMDVAYREVRDRIERSRRQFPADVDRTFLFKNDISGIPVYVLGVAVDPSVVDSYDLIQKLIIQPLERVDGVASVEANGLEQKEILIQLDRDRAAASRLNIYQLAQDLSGDSFTMASGSVRDGPRKLLLRSVARYDDLESLENRPVSPTARLKDVAKITYEEPEKDYRVRAMSKPAYAIVVFKEGSTNASQVSKRIHAVYQRFGKDPRLSEVQMIPLFDSGKVIKDALSILLQSGMIGALVAACVLFLFLRRFRLTMVINLSVPLSLLVAITVMYFSGETLNIITLLALMVCIGLLVDNSIVVAENIDRMQKSGRPKREACIAGAGEIGLAITMSTLTTVVVFLPVALVEGPGQFFLLRMAIPISVALIASLFVALVFVPLAVYLTLPGGGPPRKPGAVRRLYDRLTAGIRFLYEATFHRLSAIYSRLLRRTLRRRLDLVLALLAVFAITGVVTKRSIKFVDVQDDERGGFTVHVEMEASSTLKETEQWFLKAEKIIEAHADELDLEGWFVFHQKTEGVIQGWFHSPRTNRVTPAEATARALELLPKRPGMKLTTDEENELADDEKENLFRVTLYGEDARQLASLKRDLESVLSSVPGVVGVRKGDETPPNELGLVVDRDRAQRYGVNPQAVAGVVAYALRGQALPKYHDQGREIPVRVRFQKEDRESLDELSSFYVPTEQGMFLPVSAVTDIEKLSTPESIIRRDKRIARRITLELEPGKERQTRQALQAITNAIDLPEGVTFGDTAQRRGLNEDLAGLFFALGLSIVFIYLLMGLLFESFILPLSIIFTIPLASLGVFWIHILAGRDIDFLGVVGIVLLVGVVVNNGIVLIDYVNRLRAGGLGRSEAILRAADLRFRPIMMTALTTIGGMVPLAVAGRTEIGLSYTSFSLTLIGGMTTATLLTLLVVPIFYTFFDDVREAFGGALRRVLVRGSRREEDPTALPS
jgi:HAE1 family hydrophobic/amphiphilic exporter-1